MIPGESAAPAACGNCSTPLQGRYCHHCGQKDVDPTGTLREFAGDAVHEVAHVDGKLLLTLRWLLTRPGGLTREVLSGRRARYASPLRLYLTCSVLFFAVAAIVPRATNIVSYREPSARILTEAERAALKQKAVARTTDISAAIQQQMPRAMFALMPLFALLTWATYRRTYRHYMPHLFYSLHFHSFVFLVFAVSAACNLLGTRGETAGKVVALTVFPYHYLSLRRAFEGSWLGVAVKGTVVAVVYFLAIAAVLIAITIFALKRAGAG